ncbi:MAG TPA: hypothetical protein VD862_03415 [Candidatus Paceibacterota bacterium]|nr:hypothetical protein [Candidatus Paceibacterota bacterium]
MTNTAGKLDAELKNGEETIERAAERVEEEIDKGGKAIERAADELNIALPKSRESFVTRIIAFVLLLGGLALIGSVFGGIFDDGPGFGPTLLRMAVGVGLIAVAYGIIRRLLWSIWAVGVLAAASVFGNMGLAAFLAAAFAFLLTHRRHFS